MLILLDISIRSNLPKWTPLKLITGLIRQPLSATIWTQCKVYHMDRRILLRLTEYSSGSSATYLRRFDCSVYYQITKTTVTTYTDAHKMGLQHLCNHWPAARYTDKIQENMHMYLLALLLIIFHNAGPLYQIMVLKIKSRDWRLKSPKNNNKFYRSPFKWTK